MTVTNGNIQTKEESLTLIPLNREDVAWNMESSVATETHTFYIITKDKGFYGFQIAYTKVMGFPLLNLNIMLLGSQDKKSKIIPCSKRTFKIYEDGMRAESENFIMEIKEGDKSQYIFEIEFLEPSGIVGSFVFIGNNIGGKFNDTGSVSLGGRNYIKQFVMPSGSSKGEIVNKYTQEQMSLEGKAFYIHSLSSLLPHTLLSKCFFHYFVSDEYILISIDPKLKKGYGDNLTHTFVVEDNKVEIFSHKSEAEYLQFYKEPESKYEIPDSFALEISHHSDQNKSFILKCGQLTLLDRVDVLGQLQYLIRKMLQTIIKPYVFLFFNKATLCVNIKGAKKEVEGKMYSEISYI